MCIWLLAFFQIAVSQRCGRFYYEVALSAGNNVSVLNAATSAAEKISISLIELRRRPRELSDGRVIAVFSRLRRLHTRIPLFTRPITSHSREKKREKVRPTKLLN